MKKLILFLILILLTACTTNKKEEIKKPTINIQKKPSSREEEIKESKKLPKSFNSDKLVVNVDEVEEFYNTDLGHFSYYIPREDKGDYKVTWNLQDESEVYCCFVESDKYQKSTWCKCYKSEAYDRWLNGEELLEYQEEIIEDNKEERDPEEIEKKKLEWYQEMCNNSNVSDYLDLYDEYEQEFEDEDDAYDFYYEYCE